MPEFLIRFAGSAGTVTCALCHQLVEMDTGPQLCLTGSEAIVCRSCGRTHAPVLRALLDLAHVACQVGKISRHSRQWVPMETLLQLERAAGDYVAASILKRNPA